MHGVKRSKGAIPMTLRKSLHFLVRNTDLSFLDGPSKCRPTTTGFIPDAMPAGVHLNVVSKELCPVTRLAYSAFLSRYFEVQDRA